MKVCLLFNSVFSSDKTYIQYLASPRSFLSLSTKKLLQLSRPESDHWPKVTWNSWIITKIVLSHLSVLAFLLLLEGALYDCPKNKLGRTWAQIMIKSLQKLI